MQKIKNLCRLVLGTIGFLLSPISWWNDIWINIPIAYLIASIFTRVVPSLFTEIFISTYWLTNILGLMLMHQSIAGFVSKHSEKKQILKNISIILIYSLILILSIYFEVLKPPPFSKQTLK